MFSCFNGYKPKHRSIPTPNYRQLSRTSHFKKQELLQLLRLFESICEEDGKLYIMSLTQLSDLTFQPFTDLVIQYEYRKQGSEPMTFEQFVRIMNRFSIKETDYEKSKCKCSVLI